MARKFSSTSVETTLASGISTSTTTISVAAGTGGTLLNGVTLSPGDQFTLALAPDTSSEEIIWVTARNSDTLTVERQKEGTSAVAHNAGTKIKHVLTGGDLSAFETGINSAITASSTSTITNKTIDLTNNTLSGTTAQFNTALSDGNFATLAGSETLTSKTIALGSNTVSGTTAEFNTALTDGNFTTLAGTETLTNKTLTSPTVDDPKLNLSVNAQTGTTYTFVLTDNGKFVTASNSSAQTYSIPTNATTAFPVGTQIHIIQIGSAQVTIQAADSGTTTVLSTGATAAAPKTAKQYAAATCIKTATDTWYVIGNIA